MKLLFRSLCCLLLPMALIGCWSYVSVEAQARFSSRKDQVSLTVYPVHVARIGKGTAGDFQLGSELVDWLNAKNMADATLGRPGVPIPVRWHANQARMAEESAKAFGEWVKQANIATDYALLVEILCTPEEDKVVGVQFYFAERSGLLATGGLANSHWDEFKQINPTDRHGGLSVVKLLIGSRWSELR